MMRPPLFAHQRKLRAAAAAAILLLLAAMAILPPLQKGFFDFPGCVFHKMTGLPCPLCGGTRAASALLHGDIHRALYLNPLSLIAVATLLGAAGIFGWEAGCGRAVADWPVFFSRARPWLPLALMMLLLWWVPHLLGALRDTKTELLDLHNPIARSLYEGSHTSAR